MSMKRQSLWSMAPLLAGLMTGFISYRILYQFLGKEYSLYLAVQAFGASFGFMDLGFGMAVGRYIGVALGRGDRQAVREYWATGNALALPLLLLMSALFVAVGVFLGPRWFKLTPTPAEEHLFRWCFVAAGLGLFVNFYTLFWTVLSQAHLDFRFISILRTGMNLLQFGTIFLVAWLTRNPLAVLLWGVVVSLVQVAVFVWHSQKYYGLGFNFREFRRARLREMSGFSGKTFVGLFIGSIMASFDRLTIGRLVPAEFTNYSVASGAAGRLGSLSVAAMGPVY
jgi:hypothetical protein